MLPSHTQTSRFLQSGLFHGVVHFRQLEIRIAALASPDEQHAAFSVFAEALLAVRTLPQAAELWPEGVLSTDARRRHGLPERIVGADGLFRTVAGDMHPYQLIFRPPTPLPSPEGSSPAHDRPPLTRKEIAPFLALVDRVAQPLLFTNCTVFPPPLKNGSGFHCINGADLDRLPEHTFNAIRRWLQGGGIVPERPPLRSHQTRAMAATTPLLAAGERAVGITAPGTDMAWLTCKLAERMGRGGTVLVLLPSLLQMRDLLDLWRRHVVWGEMAVLLVCDDKPTGHDTPLLRQADLDMPLRHDSEAVRPFLTWRFQGIKVVLTTYQSVRIVARAMVGQPPWDLGLFLDGQETYADPFALDDAALPIRQRLCFAPAVRHTPNRPKIQGKAQGGTKKQTRPIWCLEDTDRYGPILPLAPLTQAIQQGDLRPWKIVIVVTPHEAPPTTMDEKDTDRTVHDTRAETSLALALRHPVCHAAHHIHTYHGTAQEAGAFAQAHSTLPHARFHMAGSLDAAERARIIDRFTQAKQGILSSARCLAEGLTIPLADMVLFFTSPKTAKLNVTRALAAIFGRTSHASRHDAPSHAQNNEREGIICLPLFLEAPKEQETDQQRLARSVEASETLWEMLQILRELDDTLEEAVVHAGEQYGRTTQWPEPPPPFDTKKGIPTAPHPTPPAQQHGPPAPHNGADLAATLTQKFTLIMPDTLPTPSATEWLWHPLLARLTHAWDRRFGQLQRYDWDTVPGLEGWVQQQRRAFAKGTLSAARVRRLEQFGFVWDLEQVAWEAMLATLHTACPPSPAPDQASQHAGTRRCLVPERWPDNPELARWAKAQRHAFKKGTLSQDRINHLNALGFVWDVAQAAWDDQFAALIAFKQQQGHGTIPEVWPPNPTLAKWAKAQRDQRKQNKLPEERQKRLDEHAFCWDLEAAHWEDMFATFVQFTQQTGHGKVPEVWPEAPSLAAWARTQRKEKAKNRLDAKRAARLEETGFCWHLARAYWIEMADHLDRFHQHHGHCMVPPGWPDNPALADWVTKQRRDFAAGRLDEASIARLTALDFVWDLEEKVWHDMFAALSQFHEAHGHCHVPDEESALANWVRKQRRTSPPPVHGTGQAHKRAEQRRKRLDALGFLWDAKEAEWDAMFRILQAFRRERNHCIVPAKRTSWTATPHPDDGTRLVRWVTQVRKAYAQGKLSEAQSTQLTKLGFIWDAKAVFWEEMFVALTAFRDQHGNCLVPETYEGHAQLAWWVTTQRKAFKAGQLAADRIARLDALGFFWDAMEAQWYEMYQALVRYHAHHGTCVISRTWRDNPKLSAWVDTQRQTHAKGHLSQVRIERLNALAFPWDQKEVVLQEMLAELEIFKREHGHCNVPVQWPTNPALGLWVQFQRQEHHKGQLDHHRVKRLEALGFSWNPL